MAKIKEKMLPQINVSKIDWSNIAWLPTTAYKAGHIVGRFGNLYKCNTDHTSGAEFDDAKFELLTSGIGYRFSSQAAAVTAAPEQFIIGNDISCGGPKPFILKQVSTTWVGAVDGTDYTLSFSEDLTEMTVEILVNGDYKINY